MPALISTLCQCILKPMNTVQQTSAKAANLMTASAYAAAVCVSVTQTTVSVFLRPIHGWSTALH
jgi:hypothetical protein